MIRRIYIAQDGRDGPIKIGMSSNVITRTRALSKKMIILAVIDGGHHYFIGNRADEVAEVVLRAAGVPEVVAG